MDLNWSYDLKQFHFQMLAYLTCDLDSLPAKSIGGFPELCAIHMWSLHKASLINPNSYNSETNLLADKNYPCHRQRTDRQTV